MPADPKKTPPPQGDPRKPNYDPRRDRDKPEYDPTLSDDDPRRDPSKREYDPRLDPARPEFDPRYHPEDPTRHQHEPPPTAGRDRASSRQAATTAAAAGKGERGEFPKPFVRLKPGAGGAYDCEVRMVADADAVTVAEAEGFHAGEVPERPAGFVEYPKWKYHTDGRRQVVHTKDEEDDLDGFEDTPPEPEAQEGGLPAGTVPAPAAGVAVTASPNRPPVPPDRG